MNKKKLSAHMAEAMDSIAKMPVVDEMIVLSRSQVVNAYHEALQIARDAMKFYKLQGK